MSLTDKEIIELEQLLHEQRIYSLKNDLVNHNDKTNPNYKLLYDSIQSQKWGLNEFGMPILESGYVGAVLEGSSRSGKTWSGIDIIIWLSLIKHPGCIINIYRATYNEFKTTLYDDFRRRLDDFDLENPFHKAKEVSSFRIGDSIIRFLGDGKHGGGCDYAFLNEAMMIDEAVFNQVKIRCRRFWWMDYNPSFTEHWVFNNVVKRDDVTFLRTTLKQNPFIKPNELNEILVFEPWLPDSYEVEDGVLMYNGSLITDKNQPPPHPKNVEQGTADEFMWKVYGLGLRGAMKGTIFTNVSYIDEWPEDVAAIGGLDFGFTSDPTAYVDYGQKGRNIYLKLYIYQPTDNPEELHESLIAVGASQYVPISADSADRYNSEKNGVIRMVTDLYNMGWEITKVSKTKNIVYWIQDMKKYKIHIVKDDKGLWEKAKTEQENYIWKTINGIQINQPIDKYNHFFDACFRGDTKVSTMKGLKSILDINTGDFVITSEGYRRVIKRWDNGVKKVIEYRMQFDTFCLTLWSTPTHKVKTDKGWIEISKLQEGMTVYLDSHSMVNNTNYTKIAGTSAKPIEKCIGMFGSSIMEKGKKNFTYITKMGILITTILKTLNLFQLLNTCQNILRKGLKKMKSGIMILDEKVLNQLKSGTQVKKGYCGILNTLKKPTSGIKHTEKANANNAELSLRKKHLHKDSVQTVVNQNTEDCQELISKQENVITAEKNGNVINTVRQDAAQKFVLVKIDSIQEEKCQVYDLHINDVHEYFANGLLVHNCRYAHMLHEVSKQLDEL